MEFVVQSKKHGQQTVTVDDEDWERVSKRKWHVWTTERHRTFYVISYEVGGEIRLHRLLTNAGPDQVVDHINGNGLDNRQANLRLCSPCANNRNARKRRNARTSKYKGVHWHDPKKVKGAQGRACWKVQIQKDGKKHFLGQFDSEIDAARAYDEAAKKLFGPFAKLNFR